VAFDAVPGVHLLARPHPAGVVVVVEDQVGVLGRGAGRGVAEQHDRLAGLRRRDRVVGDRGVVDVVLQQHLGGAVLEGVVAAQHVAGDRDVERLAAVLVVAADRQTGVAAAGHRVAGDPDAVGASLLPLRRRLDADVRRVDPVRGDDDVGAAVDVDAVGAVAPAVVLPVGRIALADDAGHVVARDHAVPGPVDVGEAVRPGDGVLEADRVDADVVVVVDDVAGDRPAVDVAVEHQRLARPEHEMIELVVVDPHVGDRGRRVGAVDGDPVGVHLHAAERAVVVAEMVDVVAAEPDGVAGAGHEYADRHRGECLCAIAGDRQAGDADIGTVADLHHSALTVRRFQAGAVEHRPGPGRGPHRDVRATGQHDAPAAVSSVVQHHRAAGTAQLVDRGLGCLHRMGGGAGRPVGAGGGDEESCRMPGRNARPAECCGGENRNRTAIAHSALWRLFANLANVQFQLRESITNCPRK
jgi:hypothetical protein